MRVRRAVPGDARAITAAFARVVEEGTLGAEPPVDLEARAERFGRQIEQDAPAAIWVLEDGRRIVGHAGLQETHAPGVLAMFVAIVAEARGRGGGRALVTAAIEHARVSGAHKVELEVWPDNAPAITLYESAGFEVEGLRRDHYRRRDGSLRSSLLMARRIAPRDAARRPD